MFIEERTESQFSWMDLGDPAAGRANLGPMAPVLVYRLLQYTLRDVLIGRLGVEATNDIFIQAGRSAGYHFCRNMVDCRLSFDEFIAQLQHVLCEQKIGILRVERADMERMAMTLTVAEDLDCSGLPFSDEVVCQYDEGFIAGILEAFTGKMFAVREIDCWASGDRVCRFEVNMLSDASP